ncbi:unnamed protein product [Auanema sp. JU1783]|nr:unnamed protein product [Auanema sp. JU1783]
MLGNNSGSKQHHRGYQSDNNYGRSEINLLKREVEFQQKLIDNLAEIMDNLVCRVKELENKSRNSSNGYAANNSPVPKLWNMTKSEYTPRKFETTKNVISVSVGKSSRGSPMRKWMSTLDMVPHKTNSSTNILHINKTSLVTTIKNPSVPNLTAYEINEDFIQLSVSNRNVRIPIPDGILLNPLEEVTPPEKLPQLHWSFGFRAKGKNVTMNVLPTSEIVYSTGNVIILYNVYEKKQRFFVSHTDQVQSIALHPNRCIMVSSQRLRKLSGKKSNIIIVWDSISLETKYNIDADNLEQVCSMSFSQSDGGTYLSLIESSSKAHVHIYNTSSKSFVAKAITASGDVLTSAWHPTRNLLAILGTKNLSIWEFNGSSSIVQKQTAVFEGDHSNKVSCFCFTDLGVLATGDSSGTITLWNAETLKTIKQAFSVHHGGVTAMTLTKKGYLLTVGKDKNVCEWDVNDLIRRKRPIEVPDENGSPLCITSMKDDSVLVGTSQNNLFEGGFEKGLAPVIQGDAQSIQCGEVWEASQSFVTGSKDGGLRIYNYTTLTVDYYRKFSDGIQCLSICQNASIIALGFSDGTISMFNLNTKEQLMEQSDNNNPVCCLKFSPNGHFLFVARKNLQAFVCRLAKDYKLQQHVRFSSLSAAVTNVDWDQNSEYLRANSNIGHSYYWAITGEAISFSIVRLLKWSTSSCKISFASGCIQHALKGFDNVTADENTVYCGNNNGSVRLYKNPYITLTAGYHELSAHSQPASVIMINDSLFVSYGEDESSLLLWKLI